MVVLLLVEVDMFSVFPYYGLENEKKKYSLILSAYSYSDSYLMKRLHNNISHNDTIC